MTYINPKYVPEDKTSEKQKQSDQFRTLLLGLRKPPTDQSSYRRRSQVINQGGVDATNYESRKRAAEQAAWMKQQQDAVRNRSVNVSTGPGQNYNFNPGGTGNSTFDKFVSAISGQESSGNYGARNRSSGAMGKYQIMPGNIRGSGRGWDYEALGRDISESQFMGSPQLQEAIARYKLQSYYKKWGPRGAAIAWYAGPGAVNRVNLNKSQGAYPTINQYANQIMKRLGL